MYAYIFKTTEGALKAWETRRRNQKTKSMSGKDAIKTLMKAGWTVGRVKGSHHMMQKNGKSVPVPYHGKDLGIGLLNTIRKQTGVQL